MAASSRYDVIAKLAAGGMATVFVGTVRGALGFRQLVAIKKAHPHLLADPTYRQELVAEARLASMIHHANVVDVRDVEIDGDEISLVMDYIEGSSLSDLLVTAASRGVTLPARAVVRIALDALAGLHAAHELVDERGRPVGLVHRDISPQNLLVGIDGTTRVADFGVAKYTRKLNESSHGSLKGKLAYMPPEYLRGESIDRRFDVFAMGIVLWEALAGERLFRGESEGDTLRRILDTEAPAISTRRPELAALDPVLAAALARDRDARFQNAQAMSTALEATALEAGLLGNHGEVATALQRLTGDALAARRALVRERLAPEPTVASLMGAEPLDLSVGVPTTEPMTAPATMTAPPATETLGVVAPLEGELLPPKGPAFAVSPQDTQLSFLESSAHPALAQPKRSRPWLVPLVVGVSTMTLASAAIFVAMTRTTPAHADPPSASPAAPPPAVSIATSTAVPADPPPASSPAVTASADLPKPPPAKKASPPKPSAKSEPPAPAAAPTTSAKKPPPNPYAQ